MGSGSLSLARTDMVAREEQVYRRRCPWGRWAAARTRSRFCS